MSMEQRDNTSPMMCRTGCGFYATQAFDGMCSKCYKDLKQIESPAPAAAAARASPVLTSPEVDAMAAALSKTSLSEMNKNASSNMADKEQEAEETASPPEATALDTASPTVAVAGSKPTSPEPSPSASQDALPDQASAPATTSVQADGGSSDGDKGKKPKKNRCMECKKKVGLTGFVCHCGKLLCSLHRYSDKHECSYDWKEKGAQEIRKNNPVIKGDKIQKI